jgi:Zn-dependent alcohol dehydrogenase
MKTEAAVLHAMGQARPFSKSMPLQIEILDLEGPGPGEVLVEIAAAGLCHSDLSVIEGSRPRVMPMVMGHEASGIVREIGVGVRGLAPGDQVVFSFVPHCGHCLPCSEGRAVLCEPGAVANVAGSLLNGARKFKDASGRSLHHHLGVSGFSRYTVAMPESLIKIDSDFPIAKAALFGCAVLTGVGAVVNTAKVRPGESVAIFGLGGVGMSAVMGARASGAYPIIAVDRLESKLAAAKKMGATHVINATNGDSVSEIRDITRGGVQYAFEAVGNAKVLESAFKATARGGKTVSIGLAHPEQVLSIQAVSLVAEEKTLMGSYMGSSVPSRDIPRFISMYRQGILPVDQLLSKTITLDKINHAFDELDKGEVLRQLLLFPA